MLYLGPKTAGGWLQKIAIAAHKTRANQPVQTITTPAYSIAGFFY